MFLQAPSEIYLGRGLLTEQPASIHFTSGGIAIHPADGLVLFNISPNSDISIFKSLST